MLKRIIVLVCGLALLNGCNTEFSVNGEYEEKPVVHFILDQGETYHFLKLNKTFLKEGNALEYAKDPSLSYFDNVVATVEEVGGAYRTWTLKDTIIHNKESGVFYAPDQKLYFFKANDLNENATYKLKINIGNGKHIVTGETKLVTDVHISYPELNFAFKLAENDVIANGYKSTPITFSLGTGAVYKAQIKFYYAERTATDTLHKSLLMDLGTKRRADLDGAKATISFVGEPFYKFLSNKIPVDQNVTGRSVEAMEIVLTAGSQDLYTYILANQPSSSIAQNKPTYTNLEGALGIFSSRATIRQYKPVFTAPYIRCLDQNSTQELCKGQYTFKLDFCSDIPLDNSTSFSCN